MFVLFFFFLIKTLNIYNINAQKENNIFSSSQQPPNINQQQYPDISPLLFQNTNIGNGGFFVRVMPTGLAYLREIGMKVVNDEIFKINLPTITETIDTGQVSIFGAYVSKYWPPVDYSLDLITPDTFTWRMSKMHLRSNGNFEARLNGALLLPSVPIQGQFESLLGHLSLSISVKMFRNLQGSPQVQLLFCAAQVGYVDLNVRNSGVITDFFINTFKAFLIAHFKPTVEQRICQMIEGIINNDLNSILLTMPLKIRINEHQLDLIGKSFGINTENKKRRNRRQRRIPSPPKQQLFNSSSSLLKEAFPSNSSLLNFISNLQNKNLILNFALIDSPFVSQGTIMIKSFGEISFNGIGETPFFAPNVLIPQPQGVHMAEFFGTDYIANSMLYHAYKQKYMDIIVGPESSPRLKDILKTTCQTGFCIGEYLGSLGHQFPDREVEIHYSAKKAPIMVFVEGKARFRLHGKMDLFVRPKNITQQKEQILRSETTLTSNVNLWIEKTQILGNASVENLDFRLIEANIHDVDQNTFGDLGLFGAEFLEKLLTEILQMGLILPSMKGVVLRSPKLSIHERYVKVQTYFKLDELYAKRLVQGAVRQTLLNIGR
uniref:BPI2 domain-containing protein n=1 Tax=Meloidogyne incognita TaxID=6306 RepID=A0A914NRD0_MELIC